MTFCQLLAKAARGSRYSPACTREKPRAKIRNLLGSLPTSNKKGEAFLASISSTSPLHYCSFGIRFCPCAPRVVLASYVVSSWNLSPGVQQKTDRRIARAAKFCHGAFFYDHPTPHPAQRERERDCAASTVQCVDIILYLSQQNCFWESTAGK